MTLPTSGQLDLESIANEFGTSYNLESLYSGNGHVPTGAVGLYGPNGTPTSIPSSGSISIYNFYGASNLNNAATLTGWWNNRASLFRSNMDSQYNNGNYTGGGLFASGSFNYSAQYSLTDTWTSHGGQGPSSGSTQTYVPTFTWGSSNMYASVWTIIVFVNQSYDVSDTGHPSWNTTPYCPGYGGTLVNNIKINGYLCAVYQVNTGVTNTPPPATASYTWRNQSNGFHIASQLHAMAIPGAWYVSNQINNPNPSAASTYSYNLGANQFSIFAGQDYGNPGSTGQVSQINTPLSTYTNAGALINSNSSGLNSMQFQDWWYNSTGTLFNINTTGSTVTQTVNGNYSLSNSNNKTYSNIQGGLCLSGLGEVFIFSQG